MYRTVHIHTYMCVRVHVSSHCTIQRSLYTLSHVMWTCLVMGKLSAASWPLLHSVCFSETENMTAVIKETITILQYKCVYTLQFLCMLYWHT